MGWIECSRDERNTTPQAFEEARGAAIALLEASAAPDIEFFIARERCAIGYLAGIVDAVVVPTPAACAMALNKIHQIHKSLGAPGDWGYDTPMGKALQWLYSSTRPLASVVRAQNKEESAHAI